MSFSINDDNYKHYKSIFDIIAQTVWDSQKLEFGELPEEANPVNVFK